MTHRKNKLTWTSDSGKTTIEVTRLPENHLMADEYRSVIHIRHNYGNYNFDGETRSNVGEDRIYSKSDRLSALLKRGKDYWSRHY